MSILLGPLSETISSVSCRDCALAEEKMAGAVTAPATAAVDFRKSRRFMGSPPRARTDSVRGMLPQRSCQFQKYVSKPLSHCFLARFFKNAGSTSDCGQRLSQNQLHTI